MALKTLRAHDLEDDTLVPMFLDEARLVATLHHQHIAQVFEVGNDDGTYFLAMDSSSSSSAPRTACWCHRHNSCRDTHRSSRRS